MSSSRVHAPSSFLLLPLAMALASVFGAAGAHAADITITGNSTAAQSVVKNQTLTVQSGATLTVGAGANAATVTGNGATITNLGTMSTTGTTAMGNQSGRIVRDNTGVTGLTVNNGSATNASAVMQTADNDVIQMNKASASVTLNNWGSMISSNASGGGAQVVDFNAITSGANIVNNYGSMRATEADAVRTGVNGVVNNFGTIESTTTTGSSSDGVDMQSNSGALINNSGSIVGGRHGITGGAANATSVFSATVNNSFNSVIRGSNGSGINIDGFNAKEMVYVTNAGTISGNGITGDGDGVDVDGLVTVVNTGTIQSLNAFSAAGSGLAFSEGMSVGGGSITNSGVIRGLVAAGNTNALGIGITLTGNDITTGINAGKRDGIYGNALVVNQSGGLIQGQNSSAIVAKGLASGYTVTINNAAGATIRGGGSSDAAIQTGLDRTVISNSGLIDGSSSGKAISMGSGGNSLTVSGGSASILGNIDGGAGGRNTMTLDIGSGNRFAYAGSIANFDTVTVASGTTTLSGQSSYTGTTVLSSGGVLQLASANTLSSASSLDLEGGTLVLSGAGSNQTFASLSLGRSSSIDLGTSSLTFASLGTIASTATLSIVGQSADGTPLYAFRLLGDYSGNTAFATLLANTTIDGLKTSLRFDGTYTTVSAVPEPASLAMLLGGLGLVGFIGRRRGAFGRA
ncbi:PEP-CTERM sorting domain-containing protein [Xylophilus rhododendri]|uniref:PEP-CTERM sorting domain-containing protein n=1 Tax=Xylophilus rhododendri TaxID=2697032 RepID=A0A857J8D4_9BURK|nr:PEP-CTERM sorting domain-containing protein [Xylophilus rhododendri]QHJ00225.1 PEP-CTERM sorting domain-containing protein [Xylophilus rhododendri]